MLWCRSGCYRVIGHSLRGWWLVLALSTGLLAAPNSALAAAGEPGVGRANLYQFDTGLQLGDARVFPPWWLTLQRNAAQWQEFDACLEDAELCPRRYRSLRTLVLKASDLDTRDKLQLVNRYMNRRKYKADRRGNNTARVQQAASEASPAATADQDQQWVGDVDLNARSHWSTLFEFMDRGGDCEDFAAAKYFLLRALGLGAEDLRVVVVWERRERSYHAILAYRWPNDEVWLLDSDNGIKKRSHRGYRYVYALNEAAVWDYRERPEWHALRAAKTEHNVKNTVN